MLISDEKQPPPATDGRVRRSERSKAAIVHALALVTSFEAWDRLRIDQRLGKQRAAEAMTRAMSALLE